jgi:hypothetical protein
MAPGELSFHFSRRKLMSLPAFPTTATIKALFDEEIAAVGGVVSNSFDDGIHLFARSMLPQVREVRTADNVQGGVALRASQTDIWVHPYVFRQVCSNGAIMAQAIQSRHVECPEFATEYEVTETVRVAIRECSSPEAFAVSTRQMRSAREIQADLALNVISILTSAHSHVDPRVLQVIMERFFGDNDQSRFGLMNAITSVARDTPDPELRWRLEELGGGVPVGRVPKSPTRDAARKQRRSAERTTDTVAV